MSEEQTPAAEPTPQPTEPEAKPEAPAGTLREQLLALVPDDVKSQVASLLDSIVAHTPAPSSDKKEEEVSPVTKKAFGHLPFRPRVTREESKREASNYGSLSDE